MNRRSLASVSITVMEMGVIITMVAIIYTILGNGASYSDILMRIGLLAIFTGTILLIVTIRGIRRSRSFPSD